MKRFTLILLVLSMLAVMVGIASAQDETRDFRARDGLIRQVLVAVAEETGLDVSDILAQLSPDGATLADVIVANGGSVESVVDVAVTNVTERVNEAVANNTITQEQADKILENVEQLITDGINGDLPFADRSRQGIERALITAVTNATGMQPMEIVRAVRDGETLENIIVSSGSSVDAVVADAMTIATERVNELVANERITQEQADNILGTLEQTFTDILNGDFQLMPPNRERGDREGRGPGILRKIAEDTGVTPIELIRQLRDGATPAQILTDAGIDVDTFVDELLVTTQERLATAVENERITQEQADERLDTIRTTLTDRLNAPIELRPDGGAGN